MAWMAVWVVPKAVIKITGVLESNSRNRCSVSIPVMPPMRTSMITKSGLSCGISSSAASPLPAVCSSSPSLRPKIRSNE